MLEMEKSLSCANRTNENLKAQKAEVVAKVDEQSSKVIRLIYLFFFAILDTLFETSSKQEYFLLFKVFGCLNLLRRYWLKFGH